MSATIIEEQTRAVRAFASELDANTKERIIEGRILPYNVPELVQDPGQPAYVEEWEPGVFRRQLRAANRLEIDQKVLLDFEHYGATQDLLGSNRSMQGVLGHGLSLDDREDALYGSFRILRGSDGDKALELAEAGVLSGFSVAARARTKVVAGGVRRRFAGILDGVALCRKGAFKGAEVLAIRTEPDQLDIELDDDDALQPLDPELALRLASFVEIPEALKPTALRAFTEIPWDGSESRWPDAASYCSSAVIDLNPAGEPKVKANCYLPVKEPGSGATNLNAVRAALSRIGQGFPKAASQAQRDSARAALERLLKQGGGGQQAA